MDIIITGKPGAGKTALCKALAERLEKKGLRCGGVLCPIAEEGGRVVGRVAVNVRSGEKRLLPASSDKYVPSPPGIEFGRRLILEARGCDVIIIDDLGPLDITSTDLMASLRVILAGDNLLVLVKGGLLDAFASRLIDHGFTVFEVREDNRDKLVDEIAAYIKRSWKK